MDAQFEGTINYKGDFGTATILQADMVSTQKLVVERETIHKSVINKNAPVMIAGKNIGKCFSLRASQDGSTLSVYFQLHSGNELSDYDRYIALPLVSASLIGCAICGLMFMAGDVACSCIYKSPVLILKKIRILGLHLLDTRCEDVNEVEIRSKMLLKHFGGALSGMDLED